MVCSTVTPTPRNTENQTTYEYNRAGQVEAETVATVDDAVSPGGGEYPLVEYSDALHPQLRIAVEEAYESGQSFNDISPGTKESVKENIANKFGISSDRFYVRYDCELVQVTVIHDD